MTGRWCIIRVDVCFDEHRRHIDGHRVVATLHLTRAGGRHSTGQIPDRTPSFATCSVDDRPALVCFKIGLRLACGLHIVLAIPRILLGNLVTP